MRLRTIIITSFNGMTDSFFMYGGCSNPNITHNSRGKIFGLKCTIIKSSEYFRNYITFAIRHSITISRVVEFNDQKIAGNVLTVKVKELLKEDLERNYLMAIYISRAENLKSFFSIHSLLKNL